MVNYSLIALLIIHLALMFFLVLNTVLFRRLLLERLDLLLDTLEFLLKVQR